MTDKEIVQALRCTSTPGSLHEDCTGCPYYRKEKLDAELKEKLGVDTWPSCDVNKVGMDAADLIERLTAENTALREGASLGKAKRPQKKAYEKSIEFLRALTDGQSDEIKSLRRELEGKDIVIALAQKEQAEAEAERDALREKQRWIPVTERLPERDVQVLGWYKDNPFSQYRPEVVAWNGNGWVFVYAHRYVTNVTYWLPLPAAPEEGGKA